MPQKKRITYQDVARVAGVSASVVSYVLNNGPRPTSAEARERVMKAIEELDYHPNAMARGLRARRTNMIGYIVYDYNPMEVFISTYSAGLLTGLTERLKERDHYVLVYPMRVGEDERALETLLRSERLDGVAIRLVQEAPATDSLIELIKRTDVPCVVVERPASARFKMPAVTYDDEQGAMLAMEYLLGKGHRRIAHIAGDYRYASARARAAGYKKALAQAKIAYDDALIYGGEDWNPEIARAALDRFFALEQPPTAIFAANDGFAIRSLELLQRRRIRCPDDIAIVGFDDVRSAELGPSPLTTIRIPLLDIGQRAADRLLNLVEDGPNALADMETVKLELVLRETA
jgi:LacI family transcriptional regulator